MANEITPYAYDGIVEEMAPLAKMKPSQYVDTILQICFPDRSAQPTDVQFAVFLQTCQQYGLNPLMKEVYGIKQKSGPIMPVVSIDGWLRMINTQPTLDGISFKENLDAKGNLISTTCFIHRKDRKHPIEVTEWLAECQRPGDVWSKYPHRMLRHKALIQCARVAYAYSGIYEEDEAARIVEATASIEVDNVRPPEDEPEPAKITHQEKAEKQAAAVSEVAGAKGKEYLKEDVEDAKLADKVEELAKEDKARGTPAPDADDPPLPTDEDTEFTVDDAEFFDFAAEVVALEEKLSELTKEAEVTDLIDATIANWDLAPDQEETLQAVLNRHLARVKVEVDPDDPIEQQWAKIAEGNSMMFEAAKEAYAAGYSAEKASMPKKFADVPDTNWGFKQGFFDHKNGKLPRY